MTATELVVISADMLLVVMEGRTGFGELVAVEALTLAAKYITATNQSNFLIWCMMVGSLMKKGVAEDLLWWGPMP